jgi:large subunit ribosomal protein L30
MADTKTLRLTLVKSPFGQLRMHRDCLQGLGLRRMHRTVVRQATPENMGMIRKVAFMLKVEEV